MSDFILRALPRGIRSACILCLVVISGCHERKAVPTLPAAAVEPPAQRQPAERLAEPSESAEAGECGTERWAVKLGYDDMARNVDTERPQPTTIDALRALLAPEHVKTSPRTAPNETSVFRLDGVNLRWYMRERDGDYHLVIADEHGDTMIAEIPAPDCIHRDSPWRALIGDARQAVEANLHHVSARRTAADEVISIVGVGFFDVIHGQRGVAPNGIELHPVLAICFGARCTPQLTRTRSPPH